MREAGHPITISGRVNAQQLAKIDAATRLAGMPRAHLLVQGALRESERILKDAVEKEVDGSAA